MIIFCNHCGRNVIPKVNGTCPGCAALISEPQMDLVSDTGSDHKADKSINQVGIERLFHDIDSSQTQTPWYQEENTTPKDIKRALLKCKPLSDPGAALLMSMSAGLGQGIASDLSDIQRHTGSIWQIGACLLPILSMVNLHVLFRIASRRAVFLRAFTRDALATVERHFLFSSMPKGIKLEGIRAPKDRPSTLYRLLFDSFAGFEYFGSPNFALEGGSHNWLARLLATLHQSRFVLVDIRTVTEHVATELDVCWKCCGPDRLFFVVDNSRTASEWLNLVSNTLNVPVTSLKPSQLLLMPTNLSDATDSAKKSQSIRQVLASVPTGTIAVGRQAFERVQKLVSSRDWKTGWHEMPQLQQVASIFLWLFIIGTPLAFIGSHLGTIYLGLLIALLGLIFFGSYGLALKRAFAIARYNQIWGNPTGLGFGFVMFATLTVLVWLGVIFCTSIFG